MKTVSEESMGPRIPLGINRCITLNHQIRAIPVCLSTPSLTVLSKWVFWNCPGWSLSPSNRTSFYLILFWDPIGFWFWFFSPVVFLLGHHIWECFTVETVVHCHRVLVCWAQQGMCSIFLDTLGPWWVKCLGSPLEEVSECKALQCRCWLLWVFCG